MQVWLIDLPREIWSFHSVSLPLIYGHTDVVNESHGHPWRFGQRTIFEAELSKHAGNLLSLGNLHHTFLVIHIVREKEIMLHREQLQKEISVNRPR